MVIGGVISSTVMTLVLLPVLYRFFGLRTAKEAAAVDQVAAN